MTEDTRTPERKAADDATRRSVEKDSTVFGRLPARERAELVMQLRLRKAEGKLAELLEDEDAWQTLLVDYHPPVIERVWRPFGEGRVFLHRIRPCDPREALMHRHPWPSAVRVLTGTYRTGVGWQDQDEIPFEGGTTYYDYEAHESTTREAINERLRKGPPDAATFTLNGGCIYTMADPDAWHWVAPADAPSLSLMVTGKPWPKKRGQHHPKPDEPLAPLTERAKNDIMETFRAWSRTL